MSRKAIFNLLKIAFAFALVWYVIDQAGWDQIRDRLSEIDRQGWLLGLGLLLASHVVALLRWHVLMHSVGLNSTPWIALRLGFIGTFFNNVVPGLTGGDLIKALYVTRENPKQRTSAVVSVIVDRVVGIVALAIIAGVVIPLDFSRYQEAALGIYGFLLAAGLGGTLVLSRRMKARLRGLFGRKEGEGGNSLLSKLDAAVSLYRPRLGVLAQAMLLSFVSHLLIIVAISIFGDALAEGQRSMLAENPPVLAAEQVAELHAELGHAPSETDLANARALDLVDRKAQLESLASVSLLEYCSILPIINIISALPVAPAGWGVGETAFKYFFGTIDVDEADSVSLSFTYRITALLISLVGGVFLLLDRKRVLEVASGDGDSDARTNA
ncbi:MAG: hypothetical protein DHS20C15_01740 [Planctomycetota bacterium]|nr:MAG: hypothetical protein DHS20C15_01740 [Planctomycetota bacterium]